MATQRHKKRGFAMKYRTKPVVKEAIQFLGLQSFDKMCEAWGESFIKVARYKELGFMRIDTLEGTHTATTCDYIIKGLKGEFYPCKQDIFEATYEKVE